MAVVVSWGSKFCQLMRQCVKKSFPSASPEPRENELRWGDICHPQGVTRPHVSMQGTNSVQLSEVKFKSQAVIKKSRGRLGKKVGELREPRCF